MSFRERPSHRDRARGFQRGSGLNNLREGKSLRLKVRKRIKKVRGQIVRQSGNTITVLPNANQKKTTYSKRDVASGSKDDNKDKKSRQRKEDKSTKRPKMSEITNKAEKAKLKRKIFKSESEPEDVGQPPNPKLYITPIPARNEINEESPEQIQIKEDVNCSENLEEQNTAIQEKEETPKLPKSGTVK